MKMQNILVIDDNDSDHIICKFTIEQYDSSITIYGAYDGQEGLETLKRLPSPPDIILLDLNMPGMDGHEFLEKYATLEGQPAPVVVLSSSEHASDINRCLEYPFVKQYLTKPLDIEKISTISQSL